MTVAERMRRIESLRLRRRERVAAHRAVRDLDARLVDLVAQQLRAEVRAERRSKR